MRLLRITAAARSVRFYSISGSSPQLQQPLHFLDGKRVDPLNADPDKKFNLTNPATGEVYRSVSCSGKDDIDRAVSSARKAFKAWKNKSGFERGQVLRKAAEIVRSRLEEFARVETLDTGKPIWESRYDIQSCADSIDYYGGLAARLAGEHMALGNGSFAYTVREPLGVVGGIGAWNYPLQMASWKSSPALAVGNTIIFKPSQMTPLTAVMLGEAYREAGLPDGCYNVIQGEAETGQLLTTHSGVDKVSFTGSVTVGSKIMEAGAKTIKHLTLELGGKSPLIIFADSNLNNAVTGAMLANFLTQGQVCSNGTRVFVERKILDEFLKRLVERTRKMKIGDPNAEDTTVGATITPQQADKVLRYVQGAKAEGAKVLCGGERVDPGGQFSGGIFVSPCVLGDCHDDMTVVREEVFGSVMSVLPFDNEEEVLRRANDTEFGLAGGVFTNNLQQAHRVASQLEAGSLYVNNYNVYPVGVPFGGFKKSGIGRENGPDTLDYYSQVKSVYVEMNDVEAPF